MLNLQRFLALVVLACGCLTSNAGWGKNAQTITITFGDNTLPFTLPEAQDKRRQGISVDIIRESLEAAGYRMEPKFVPYARRLILYKTGMGSKTIDAAVDVNEGYVKDQDLKGFLSVPTLAYQNVIISLKSRGLKIGSVADLAPYSVLAWQGAATVMGAAYQKMANANPNYEETADQSSQVKRLFLKRIETIQMARTIFLYWKKEIAAKIGNAVDTTQPVDVAPIFDMISYSVLFKDQKVQRDFDREYLKLVAKGRLQEVLDFYTK